MRTPRRSRLRMSRCEHPSVSAPRRLWTLLLLLIMAAALWRYGDLREPALTHGDEALTALRARSLLREGSFWTPYWNGTVNLHKPPLYYWMVAVGYLAFGVGELAVRLPSVAAFLLLLWLAARIDTRLFSPAAGIASAALLAWHPVLVVQSRLGMMDTLVTLLYLAGGVALWHGRRAPGGYLGWGACAGAAVLAKGGGALLVLPVSLAYLGVAQRAAFRRGAFYGGLLLSLGLPAVWFGSQFLLHRRAFLETYVHHEVARRWAADLWWPAFAAQKTTRRLWCSLGALAPLTAAAPVLLYAFRRGWRYAEEGRNAFFLVALAVGALLLTNMVGQQMYWYIVPPSVPFLLMTGAVAGGVLAGRWTRWQAALALALLLAGLALPRVVLPRDRWWALAAALAGVSAMGGCLWRGPASRWTRVPAALALALTVRAGLSFENDRINFFRPRSSAELKQLAAAIPKDDNARYPLVVDFRYFPMNALMFYADRTAIQAAEMEQRAPPEANRLHAVLANRRSLPIAGWRATFLDSADGYELWRLDREALAPPVSGP